MATNVEVTKNNNESPVNLIRRFTKRVRGAGILPRVRSIRYNQRPESTFKRKLRTLRSISKKEEIAMLKKMGKMK